MQTYQREFIELAMEQNVLQFGEFELKSGRLSPYFFNSGLFRTGRSAAALARYYAAAAAGSGIEFDMLFGPAYKGIPLVALTAAGLADQGDDYPYCFNRKEAKDHGEGGNIVGGPIEGRILIVDDVITAGTAIRESVEIIRAAGAEPAGVLIALDRQERGQGSLSAVQEAEQELGLKVASIIGLNHLIEHLSGDPDTAGLVERMNAYRSEYGITA